MNDVELMKSFKAIH